MYTCLLPQGPGAQYSAAHFVFRRNRRGLFCANTGRLFTRFRPSKCIFGAEGEHADHEQQNRGFSLRGPTGYVAANVRFRDQRVELAVQVFRPHGRIAGTCDVIVVGCVVPPGISMSEVEALGDRLVLFSGVGMVLRQLGTTFVDSSFANLCLRRILELFSFALVDFAQVPHHACGQITYMDLE